jgi:hypothetical protein
VFVVRVFGPSGHQYLAQTVQSYPASPVVKHETTRARNSTAKWYIKRGLDIGRSVKAGKLINHGWQEKADKAPQPTGIITGANLKKPVKPNQKPKKLKSD